MMLEGVRMVEVGAKLAGRRRTRFQSATHNFYGGSFTWFLTDPVHFTFTIFNTHTLNHVLLTKGICC